jgi:hypothetical protein
MQWFLHRVTAISGAAEPQDDFHYDSDSDGDVEEALHQECDWDNGYRGRAGYELGGFGRAFLRGTLPYTTPRKSKIRAYDLTLWRRSPRRRRP